MIGEKAKFIGYKKIKIEDLVRCPLNPRNDYGNLEELTDTIVEDGLLDDLVVREKDGKYEVICGERRREAAINATLKEVNCKVYQMTDSIARRWIAIEDFHRESLQPYERGKLYVEWMKTDDLTEEDLSSIVACSRETISHYSSFAKKIDPEVGKNVKWIPRENESEAKTLSFNKAQRLTSLTGEVQKELASEITTNGMTEKEVVQKVKGIQEIEALINRPQTSKEDKEKLTKEILDDPKTLVSTEPWEVRHKLGIEEPVVWDSFGKWATKLKSYAGKKLETEGVQMDETKMEITFKYKKNPKKETEED